MGTTCLGTGGDGGRRPSLLILDGGATATEDEELPIGMAIKLSRILGGTCDSVDVGPMVSTTGKQHNRPELRTRRPARERLRLREGGVASEFGAMVETEGGATTPNTATGESDVGAKAVMEGTTSEASESSSVGAREITEATETSDAMERLRPKARLHVGNTTEWGHDIPAIS